MTANKKVLLINEFKALEAQAFAEHRPNLTCSTVGCEHASSLASDGVGGNPTKYGATRLRYRCRECHKKGTFSSALLRLGTEEALKTHAFLESKLKEMDVVDKQAETRADGTTQQTLTSFLQGRPSAPEPEIDMTPPAPVSGQIHYIDRDDDLVPKRKVKVQVSIPTRSATVIKSDTEVEELSEHKDPETTETEEEGLVTDMDIDTDDEEEHEVHKVATAQMESPSIEYQMHQLLEEKEKWLKTEGELLNEIKSLKLLNQQKDLLIAIQKKEIEKTKENKKTQKNTEKHQTKKNNIMSLTPRQVGRDKGHKITKNENSAKSYAAVAAAKPMRIPPRPGNELRSAARQLANKPIKKLSPLEVSKIIGFGQEKPAPQIFHRRHIQFSTIPNERVQDTRRRMHQFLKLTGLLPHIRTFSTVGRSIMEIYYCTNTARDVAEILNRHKLCLLKDFDPADFTGILEDTKITRLKQVANRLGYLLAKERIQAMRNTILAGFDTDMVNAAHIVEKEIRKTMVDRWDTRYSPKALDSPKDTHRVENVTLEDLIGAAAKRQTLDA